MFRDFAPKMDPCLRILLQKQAIFLKIFRKFLKNEPMFRDFGSTPPPRGLLSFHNFGTLGSQLKTRYNNTLGEKWKGDLYHKRLTS